MKRTEEDPKRPLRWPCSLLKGSVTMEIHDTLYGFPFLKSQSNYINDQWSRKSQNNSAPKVVDLEIYGRHVSGLIKKLYR